MVLEADHAAAVPSVFSILSVSHSWRVRYARLPSPGKPPEGAIREQRLSHSSLKAASAVRHQNRKTHNPLRMQVQEVQRAMEGAGTRNLAQFG